MTISPKRFLQRLVESLRPAREPDAADLGTAFGMEYSLAEHAMGVDIGFPTVPPTLPLNAPQDSRR
jgi:hypothetical protein